MVRIVNIIKEDYLESSINDPVWDLPKPEEKPKKQVDDDPDGNNSITQNRMPLDAPADPADGDENKPKFNIFEHAWTKSDGLPKNIAQVYTQLKQPQSVAYPIQTQIGTPRSFRLLSHAHFQQLRRSVRSSQGGSKRKLLRSNTDHLVISQQEIITKYI